MSQSILEIVVGLALILSGLVLVVKRQGAAHLNGRALSLMHGGKAESAVRNSTPGRLAFVGVVGMILGTALLVHRLYSLWTG